MTRYLAAFVLGAVIAGYAAWVLKPSSPESLALGIAARFADAQAAAERAEYETRLEEAQLDVEIVTAQVDEANILRVAAEVAATTARQDAIEAQERADQFASSLETAQEAVAVAERAFDEVPDLVDTGRALIEAQRLDITSLTTTLVATQGVLASTEHAYTLLEDAYVAQGQELTLSQQATAAITAVATLATARVEQLDGRRVRWGVGVTAGCNPLSCTFGGSSVVVGLTAMWGK